MSNSEFEDNADSNAEPKQPKDLAALAAGLKAIKAKSSPQDHVLPDFVPGFD